MATNYFDNLAVIYESEITALSLLVGANPNDLQILYAIDKACKCILKYTGWTVFDTLYTPALIALATAYINNDKFKYQVMDGHMIQASKTQGSRSESYLSPVVSLDSDGLTIEVKAMLPLPKLKVV